MAYWTPRNFLPPQQVPEVPQPEEQVHKPKRRLVDILVWGIPGEMDQSVNHHVTDFDQNGRVGLL